MTHPPPSPAPSIEAMLANVLHAGLILLAMGCCRKTFTSPSTSASDDEQKKYNSSDPMLLPISLLAGLYQVVFYALNVVELRAALIHDATPFQYLINLSMHLPEGTYLSSPERSIGLAIIVAGAALRIVCYRRMKQYFTFHLALRDNHKLITDGPYSYVRHPSYTGACAVLVGSPLFSLGRGSWWAEHALTGRSPWLIMGILHVILSAATIHGGLARCDLEDEVLRKHFKDEWVQWAKRTPYRLVPFVY